MTLSRLSADGGCYHISSADGAVSSKLFFGFTVLEDTVLTVCTLNTTPTGFTSTNYLTQANMSGKTLKAGTYICAPAGSYITAITASSGSLIAYNFVS
jgi:hypothetical protein